MKQSVEWALLTLLWDARTNLQSAEGQADCEHLFGFAQDVEALVYELDRLVTDLELGRSRRRRRDLPITGSEPAPDASGPSQARRSH